MSVYIQCNSLTKTISAKELFSNLTFTISEGDRIGLIGLNGCGKSTLVRMLTGEESVDGGEIIRKKGLVVGYVPQSSVFEDVSPKEVLITAMGKGVLEHDRERLAMRQLEKLGFTGEEESAAKLSGGWKKRLSIASELVKNPDVLLLDEPTNHLDLEGIVWLEKFLAAEGITYLLISHDRYFLEHATNRIMEIDKIYPEGVFSIKASYKEFLVQKERFIKGQLEQERSIAGKVRKETAWLRAGLKARTTKAQSRIDEAHDMMDRYAAVKKRNRQVHSKIDFEATGRETRKLMVIKNASKSLGEKKLFENLDITFSPGTRLGLLGPNGCGKTTLLKMLAGEMESDTGTIKRAENLQVVYFDQHRERLPLDITLKEALSPNKEYVEFRGSKIHVRAWAKRFLFEPELLPVPISTLSGGERARITIAHLMCKKADVLLLDEPTNDLDIPTLETLEESLLDFPGAIVLITHDRCMMDRVCSEVLAVDEGKIYADYYQWKSHQKEDEPKVEKGKKAGPSISYAKKKEAEKVERKIAKLEGQLQQLNEQLAVNGEDPKALEKICSEIALLETQMTEQYLIWEGLLSN